MHKDLKNIDEGKKMERNYFNKTLLILSTTLLLFTMACDYAASTAPEAPIATNVVAAEEINWVSWKPEILENINSRDRVLFKKGKKNDVDAESLGFESKWIKADKGGNVGSKNLTLDNKVKITPDALREDAEVSVELVNDADNPNNGFGEVEFRVNEEHYQFEKDVTITLSYKYLDLPDDFDPTNLTIWWYEDNSENTGWVELEDLEFNTNKKIVKFKIDHFTRYGWAY